MNVRWRKVWGDFRESPTRFFLVALTILIGTTALAATLTANGILRREVTASFQSSRPAAIVFTLDSVSNELVEKARVQTGVIGADSRRIVRARAEVASGDWRTLLIFGVRDFRDVRVSTFRSMSGDFPPKMGEILVEQSSLSVLKTEEDKFLRIRTPGGFINDVSVGGTVLDTGLAPGWQDNNGYAYASPETLQMLGQTARLDELRITLAPETDKAQVAKIAVDLSEWLKLENQVIRRIELPIVKHPHADLMNTLLTLLLIFSVLALLLSGVLTVNVMAALMAKQMRQIGIMKSVGASSRQIAVIYLIQVLIMAIVAVGIGLPLGGWIGRAYSQFATGQLNLDVVSWSIPFPIYLIVVLTGIGVPLVAALIPVWRAVRIPAREALQDVGVKPPVKATHFGKWSALVSSDRRLILALRNTFRRPVRMWLSLMALALGGALLLTGINVYSSLVQAVSDAMAHRSFDVDVSLQRPAANGAELAEKAKNIVGVKTAEAWNSALVSFAVSENVGQEMLNTNRYSILAPPTDSLMMRPKIIEGRWFEPNETGVIVVNRYLRDTETEIKNDTTVNLVFAGKITPVRVVGIVEEIGERSIYTNSQTLEAVTGLLPKNAGTLRLSTEPGQEQTVAAALEQMLADENLIPRVLVSRQAIRQSMVDHFIILLFVLTALSLAALIIGSIGLATTMSLNVLERRREIGVIRAIGATPKTVLWIFLTEALTIAVLSIVLAIIISLPLSAFIGLVVGSHGLHATLPFVVSVPTIIGWILLALVITLLASVFPAWGTIRLSVRDTLAYE